MRRSTVYPCLPKQKLYGFTAGDREMWEEKVTLKEPGVCRMCMGAEPLTGICRGVVGSLRCRGVSASVSSASDISSWICLASLSSPRL